MNNIDKYNILIGNKEKNLIEYYTNFYKIYYITPHYTLYNINIELNITDYKHSNYYNYIRLHFNKELNMNIIDEIRKIEEHILSFSNKISKNVLYNDFNKGCIKIQKNEKKELSNIILRITGIWENETQCGLTYKIYSL